VWSVFLDRCCVSGVFFWTVPYVVGLFVLNCMWWVCVECTVFWVCLHCTVCCGFLWTVLCVLGLFGLYCVWLYSLDCIVCGGFLEQYYVCLVSLDFTVCCGFFWTLLCGGFIWTLQRVVGLF